MSADNNQPSGGPLAGYKVIELAGLGPAPLAGMILADLGAEVVVVERKASKQALPECSLRGKRSIVLDLKRPGGRGVVERLIERAGVFVGATGFGWQRDAALRIRMPQIEEALRAALGRGGAKGAPFIRISPRSGATRP